MPPVSDDILVAGPLRIPMEELVFSFSRSGGPGGQNVNKVNTRVSLEFDVAESPSLRDDHRRRIMTRLKTRISKDGILRVVAQDHRTQLANRQSALERLAELLADALFVPKARRPTRVPRAAKRRRLEDKRRRGERKRLRKPVPTE